MDTMWLVRIIVGVIVTVGSSLGVFKVFQLDCCSVIEAKETGSQQHDFGIRKKFLF